MRNTTPENKVETKRYNIVIGSIAAENVSAKFVFQTTFQL